MYHVPAMRCSGRVQYGSHMAGPLPGSSWWIGWGDHNVVQDVCKNLSKLTPNNTYIHDGGAAAFGRSPSDSAVSWFGLLEDITGLSKHPRKKQHVQCSLNSDQCVCHPHIIESKGFGRSTILSKWRTWLLQSFLFVQAKKDLQKHFGHLYHCKIARVF